MVDVVLYMQLCSGFGPCCQAACKRLLVTELLLLCCQWNQQCYMCSHSAMMLHTGMPALLPEPQHRVAGCASCLPHLSGGILLPCLQITSAAVLARPQQAVLARDPRLLDEGVMLVDVSSPMWPVIYANSAFSELTGVPSVP